MQPREPRQPPTLGQALGGQAAQPSAQEQARVQEHGLVRAQDQARVQEQALVRARALVQEQAWVRMAPEPPALAAVLVQALAWELALVQ